LAHHKSAKKRARQNPKRRARNRHVRTGLKSAIKSAHTQLAGGASDEATTALRGAEGTIRRAASKGVISKKHASRKISRLAKAANRA